MLWGAREIRHRNQAAPVWVCDALLGHDIANGNKATELLTWHRCWADKNGEPAIDYTKPKFIMVPMKDGAHGWFLVTICHLTARRNDRYKPCALILDPRNETKHNVHTDAVTAISTYMRKWRKCTWNQEQEPF